MCSFPYAFSLSGYMSTYRCRYVPANGGAVRPCACQSGCIASFARATRTAGSGCPKPYVTFGMPSAAATIGPASSACSHTITDGDHSRASGSRSSSIGAARSGPKILENRKSGRSAGGTCANSG
jgi:hypothetical protein